MASIKMEESDLGCEETSKVSLRRLRRGQEGKKRMEKVQRDAAGHVRTGWLD